VTLQLVLFLDLVPAPEQLGQLETIFDCLETAPLYGDRPGAKLHRVQSVAGDRPIAWLALDPVPDAYRWAARRTKRGTPTLLLNVGAEAEVSERNVDTLLRWARRVTRAAGGVLDIGSMLDGPAGALSNFSAHAFVFRGERMASMEGLLQSLKCPAPERQAELWQLTGSRARNAGSGFRSWRERQTLYWRGEAFDRHGPGYQDLLDEAYRALFDQNEAAREALLATGDLMLDHSVGKTDPRETVLTVDEFCSRLEQIRGELNCQPPA
jgi:predicted NAD-dependent protein-ADP-ribosyltransferase YbiA (DUF1768 family)